MVCSAALHEHIDSVCLKLTVLPSGTLSDDLKETKSRLLHEIEGLKRSLDRKDRNAQEVLTRARMAESALGQMKKTHETEMVDLKRKVKSLEEGTKKAEDARLRAESSHDALAQGMR